MQYSVLVTVCRPHQQLVDEASNSHRIERSVVSILIHILFQVALAIFENEDELCLGVDDIVEAKDVDMLELLHERDLTDSSGRGSLFSIKMYLFEGDDFVGCARSALTVEVSG